MIIKKSDPRLAAHLAELIRGIPGHEPLDYAARLVIGETRTELERYTGGYITKDNMLEALQERQDEPEFVAAAVSLWREWMEVDSLELMTARQSVDDEVSAVIINADAKAALAAGRSATLTLHGATKERS